MAYVCNSLRTIRVVRTLKDYRRVDGPAAAPAPAGPSVFMRDGFTGNQSGSVRPEAEVLYALGGVGGPAERPEQNSDSETSGSDGAFMNRMELAEEFLELRAAGADMSDLRKRNRQLKAGTPGVSLQRGGVIATDRHGGRPLHVVREELLRDVLQDRYHPLLRRLLFIMYWNYI
jgi:hypothetical protein